MCAVNRGKIVVARFELQLELQPFQRAILLLE